MRLGKKLFLPVLVAICLILPLTIPAYAESNIVILEVEPNPAGTDAGNEWVRLFNPSSNSINLSGWQISSTHGNTNTHTLSGNIGACNDMMIFFSSQFIDNEGESLILYDNTGRVVDSTPSINDKDNDASTWKTTTPSCESSQPTSAPPPPPPEPEPEPEYLANGCPIGYPYIWSDGFCYSVPEPVATPAPTTPKPSKQAGDTYYFYADELPSWADYAVNVLYDSTRYWEEPNPGLKFYVADNPNVADFRVRWVKDFGGEHAGYAYGKEFVEVGLGDSNCSGKWQPYSANYVNQIMTHEIGHVLGLDHSNDVNSIMYPIAIHLEYGTVEDEFTLTEDYAQFYSPCTVKDVTSIYYSVSTDDPTYGFDVYFVPSIKSLDDWKVGKPFKYYSDKECFGKNYRSYSGTCNGVAQGSGLLVIMDSKLTNPLTQVTIKTQEISNTRGYPSAKIATEDPTIPRVSATPKIPTTPTIPTIPTTPTTPTEDELSSTAYGEIRVDKKIVEVSRYSDGMVKILGKVSDEIFSRGHPVIFSITKPDRTTVEIEGIVSKDKTFQLPIKLDYEFELGKYTIRGEYKGYDIGQTYVKLVEPGTSTPQIEPEIKKEKIPGWIKNNAKWWAEGQIGDSDFVGGIQHMIKEKIINIPNLPPPSSETAEEKVPDWIKTNAKWWADGLISEDDFVQAIEYLVKVGIIRV